MTKPFSLRALESAEKLWDERISPTLRGHFTINRSGICHTITSLIVGAHDDGVETAARYAYRAGHEALADEIRSTCKERRSSAESDVTDGT